jgi:hypothetical protein
MNLRLLRGLAGASTLALLATAMLSAPAMGANAREVYFGSPESSGGTGGSYQNGDLVFGTLTNTTVTTSGRSKIDLVLRNDDGQTLNHIRMAGGDETTGLAFNPAFLKPSGTSLGNTSIAFFQMTAGPAGASCSWDNAGFLCDIGTLAPDAFAAFTIVLNAPATASAPHWFTASWNEGWSSTGTNADYNFAVGDLEVVTANCTNGTASWFLDGEPVNLTDGDPSTNPANACGNTSASVRSGAVLVGTSGYAQAVFDPTTASCPTAITRCFGRTVDVQILNGASVPGGVIWTMQFVGTKVLGGIIHYKANYNPNDASTYDVIPLTKKFKCNTTTLTRNCWNSITPSGGGVKPVSVTVEFVTDSNGKGGGFL